MGAGTRQHLKSQPAKHASVSKAGKNKCISLCARSHVCRTCSPQAFGCSCGRRRLSFRSSLASFVPWAIPNSSYAAALWVHDVAQLPGIVETLQGVGEQAPQYNAALFFTTHMLRAACMHGVSMDSAHTIEKTVRERGSPSLANSIKNVNNVANALRQVIGAMLDDTKGEVLAILTASCVVNSGNEHFDSVAEPLASCRLVDRCGGDQFRCLARR